MRLNDIHISPCSDQPNWNCFRFRGHGGFNSRTALQSLDGTLSSEHHSDKRDWILFPLPRHHSRNHRWHHLVGSTGSGNLCALHSQSRRVVALDLRRHRDDVTLSERVRFDCPAFPKSAGSQSPGAHSNGAVVSSDATHYSSDFYRFNNFGGDQVSDRAGSISI